MRYIINLEKEREKREKKKLAQVRKDIKEKRRLRRWAMREGEIEAKKIWMKERRENQKRLAGLTGAALEEEREKIQDEALSKLNLQLTQLRDELYGQ